MSAINENRYNTLDLSDPKTYESDPELASAARVVANIHFDTVFADMARV